MRSGLVSSIQKDLSSSDDEHCQQMSHYRPPETPNTGTCTIFEVCDDWICAAILDARKHAHALKCLLCSGILSTMSDMPSEQMSVDTDALENFFQAQQRLFEKPNPTKLKRATVAAKIFTIMISICTCIGAAR